MPDIEALLQRELRRVTDHVQPEQLRPLRDPAHGPHGLARRLHGNAARSRGAIRPRWVLPSAVAASVALFAALAILLANLTATRPPVRPQASSPMPRFYVAITANGFAVHASLDGRVTGTATLPDPFQEGILTVNAAADDRTFIISDAPDSGDSVIVYRLLVRPSGAPGHVTRIGSFPLHESARAVALSPDGTRLAVTFVSRNASIAKSHAGIETINLMTGQNRKWTAQGYAGYWAETPSWSADDSTVTFPWLHLISRTTNSWSQFLVGIGRLDTTTPGTNLLSSPLVSFPAPIPLPNSQVGRDVLGLELTITTDGTGIFGVSCGATTGQSGTVTEKIVELSATTGRLGNVIWERATRYTSFAGRRIDYLKCTEGLWSVDASGQHLLIQAFGQFGRVDNGVFTPLPGEPFVGTSAFW